MNEMFVMSLKANHLSEVTILEYTKAIDNCMTYFNKPYTEIKPIYFFFWYFLDSLQCCFQKRTRVVLSYWFYALLYRLVLAILLASMKKAEMKDGIAEHIKIVVAHIS